MAKFKDLTGKQFKKLTVVSRHGSKNGAALWDCECVCGKPVLVVSADLNRGKYISCGTCSKRGNKVKVGQKHGRWTVKEEVTLADKGGNVSFVCQCECGTIRPVLVMRLVDGSSKSCGCLQKELTRQRSTTHGKHHTRIYRTWVGIRQRCDNPNNNDYHNYGGRGISYCKEWRNFETFYEWATRNGYSDDLTIERKEVNGNYEPLNVTFISKFDQHSNRRDNIWMNHDGKTRTVAQWGRILNVSPSTIKNWYTEGLSIKDGIKRRIEGKNIHRPEYNGQKHTLKEWEEILKIPEETLYAWNRNGISIQEGIERRLSRLFQSGNEFYTLAEWSRRLDIPDSTLGAWCRNGLDIDGAIKKRGIKYA